MADDGALILSSPLSEELRLVAGKEGYESAEAVILEALEDWRAKRTRQAVALAALRADIQVGIDDIEAGRVYDFDVEEIIEEARRERAAR